MCQQEHNPKHVTSDIIQIIWIVSPLPCMVIRIQIDIWIVSVVSILWILIPVTHLDCGTHVLWFVSVLTVWILSPSPPALSSAEVLTMGMIVVQLHPTNNS